RHASPTFWRRVPAPAPWRALVDTARELLGPCGSFRRSAARLSPPRIRRGMVAFQPRGALHSGRAVATRPAAYRRRAARLHGLRRIRPGPTDHGLTGGRPA